jgi:hypothetical protein
MRNSMIARFALGALALTISFQAQAWDKADKAGIRKVIRTQVKSMQTTDPTAFANTVSPGLRAMFPNQDALYGTLVGKIPALEGATEVGFGPLKTTDVGLIQLVLFTDKAGQPWTAMFIMEQQNGSWFVKGVQAKKRDARLA